MCPADSRPAALPLAQPVPAAQGPTQAHSGPCSLGEEQQPPTHRASLSKVQLALLSVCHSLKRKDTTCFFTRISLLSLRVEKMQERKSS